MDMATTRRDEVIDWLNDAYAMERGLEITLRKQAENNDMHRAVRERALQMFGALEFGHKIDPGMY